jgi:hypothetical protein
MVEGGTPKIRATLREPQRGHFKRLSRRESGNSAPRVHTSVSKSRSDRSVRLHGLTLAGCTAGDHGPTELQCFANSFDPHGVSEPFV